MGEHMTGQRIIGYRKSGAPIHLVAGGADDDGGDSGNAPAASDDTAALRAELEQARQQAAQTEERLRAFMAANEPPATPAADDADPEDEPEGGKPADPEMAKLRRALREANRESKARREAAERLRSEWEQQEQATKAQVAEAQKLAEAAEKARLEAEARYKPATIKAAAVPALLAAGAKPERADRLVRLLDHTALDVDTSGEVTGLAEQVAAVKADYPELFATGEERSRAPRVATGDRPPVADKPLTTAERIAQQVLGGAA
jgi:hypothetical protein